MKTYTVRMVWDEGYWHSEIDDDAGFGLTLNSGSFDALVERVRIALPDMLEECFGYTGPVEIIFETEHVVTTRGTEGDGGLYAQSQKAFV